MATKASSVAGGSIGEAIVAIREKWHTKNHPLFQDMARGSLDLRALGVYMAKHFRFVEIVYPGLGLLFYRAPSDVKTALITNAAEEEGIKAIDVEGHEPHDHNELIFRFCAAVGLSEDEVRNIDMSPAWWGRSLHYLHCMRDEPVGVALAMQSTQEGQQVALNNDVTIPAFAKHYGYTPQSPEIEFFTEHAEADLEHSSRQMSLCLKYLEGAGLDERVLKVCEEACRLRWASISEIYREHVLNEPDILPPGMAA